MRLRSGIIVFILVIAVSLGVASYASSTDVTNTKPTTTVECEVEQCPLPTNSNSSIDSSSIDPQPVMYTKHISSINAATSDGSLFENNYYIILGQFWLLGLLLGFTPCVLPLIILMVGFLGGESNEISRKRMILFVLTYVLSLSTTYALLGIVMATSGAYFQAYFQHPWVLGITSVVIFLLSLSLLGFYDIKLPSYLQHIVVRHNKFRSNYQFIEVAFMGILATLIASPCIAAPLAVALGYIGSTGNVILGGLSLFFIGFGIGTPLIIASIFNKEILPHPGKWQYILKDIFALMMICMALLLSASIMPSVLYMFLWSLVVVFAASYISRIKLEDPNINLTILLKSMVIMLLFYGMAIFVGSLIGNKNPFNPLSISRLSQAHALNYINVSNNKELDLNISKSLKLHKPVLIIFTAEWCMACRDFQNNVLNTDIVTHDLLNYTLLKVDLTNAKSPSYDIARRYKVPGAPYLMMINEKGIVTNIIIDDDLNPTKLQNILHDLN